jgi:hypothetical protein
MKKRVIVGTLVAGMLAVGAERAYAFCVWGWDCFDDCGWWWFGLLGC